MEVIHTTPLYKSYGATTALDQVRVTVHQGEIYGFLGLNGAGKTTLIRIMLGMIKADAGSVRLFGQEVKPGFDRWNDIGYLVETPYAYPNLSVRDNLRVFHKLRDLQDVSLIDQVIDRLKLTQYRNKKAGELSLGNRQRLGLAKALMHRPRLLILDEPINGLDPEGIVEMRLLLKELAAAGSTIFLSSHIIDEVAKVATRIGMIHQGRLMKELNATELHDQLQRRLIINTRDDKAALAWLHQHVDHVELNADRELEVNDPAACERPEEITRSLVAEGLPPTRIFVRTEALEAFFLRTIRGKR